MDQKQTNDLEKQEDLPSEPSLRSEFGSGSSLPGDGVLRYGPAAAAVPETGAARTYAFTREREPARVGAEQAGTAPDRDCVPQPQTGAGFVPPAANPAGGAFSAQTQPAIPYGQQAAVQPAAAYIPVHQVNGQSYFGPAVPVGTAIPCVLPNQVAIPYAIPVPPQPAAPAPAPKQEIKQSSAWLWVAVAAALILGLLLGAFGYQLLTDRSAGSQGTAQPQSTEQPAGQANASEIYDANVNAVVGIYVAYEYSEAGDEMINAGTGFVLTADGYLLTNYHVVQGASAVVVTLLDGRQLPARIVNTESETSDLALLKVEATDLQPVVLGDSDSLRVGDWICTIGNPLGELDHSMTVGYLSAKERAFTVGETTLSMLQTNAAINAGNSGGPLLDAAGKAVGVVTAKYSGGSPSGTTVEGLAFAIPIRDAVALTDAWMQADRAE